MTPAPGQPAVEPWAFWAPASNDLIESALEVAGLQAGERFLDLGCGDGRVLLAAARRGARVQGLELDPEMARRARKNLAAAGSDGVVVEGDIFQADIQADVVYAYLTPVTVFQLKPVFARSPAGTRIVTPAFSVLGWQPDAIREGSRVYRMPAQAEAPHEQRGWAFRALVYVLQAGRRNLIPFVYHALPGPVEVDLDGPLSRAAKVAVGDHNEPVIERLPVELIFHGHVAGSVIAGSISANGQEMTVAVVFANDGHGCWRFTGDQGQEFRAMLAEKIDGARRPRLQAPAS